VVCLDHCSGV